MKGRIFVHVHGKDNGKPMSNAKISVFLGQFMASGVKECGYTNSDGVLGIDLDIDYGAYITVFINGYEQKNNIYPKDGENYSFYM